MIRINLLPFRAARKRENIRREVSIFILLMIFLCVGLYYYGIHLDKKITKLKKQITVVENDIALYKEKADRVNVIKKLISTYERKVDIIKSLKNRRREAITLLDNMTELVVPERMWLNSLQMDRRTVTIKGIAFDQKTVADFMIKLGDSSLFEKEIRLNTLKMEIIGKEKTVLKAFELLCTKKISQIEKNLTK